MIISYGLELKARAVFLVFNPHVKFIEFNGRETVF